VVIRSTRLSTGVDSVVCCCCSKLFLSILQAFSNEECTLLWLYPHLKKCVTICCAFVLNVGSSLQMCQSQELGVRHGR
jgi:hypothetical protein